MIGQFGSGLGRAPSPLLEVMGRFLFQGDQGAPGPPGPKVIQDSTQSENGGKPVAQIFVLLCRVSVVL